MRLRTWVHRVLLWGAVAAAAPGCRESQTRISLDRLGERLNHLRQDIEANRNVDEAYEALHAQLGSPDYLTRLNTIILLGKIGPRAARAVPWLIDTLGDSDPVIRRESALSLTHFGPAAEPATEALIDTIRRYPSTDAAWFAADALGNIGQAAVVHLSDLRDHWIRYRKQYGDRNPGTESFEKAVQKLESVVSDSDNPKHAEPSDAAESR